ncbi:MAG: hypothetical protein KZQ81_11780 [Candidatus Thiodiazotropha sp. (ex Rostrolucina anterorostrata)]|nr:hypothetical protein [Candidatus Thiodiazotropha sp. (ex Rostrolucina anterorostrata)]
MAKAGEVDGSLFAKCSLIQTAVYLFLDELLPLFSAAAATLGFHGMLLVIAKVGAG